MKKATDGHATRDGGAGMHRTSVARRFARLLGMVGCCAMLLCMAGSPRAWGHSSPGGPGLAPSLSVVANQAMSLFEEPKPDDADSGTTANRPLALERNEPVEMPEMSDDWAFSKAEPAEEPVAAKPFEAEKPSDAEPSGAGSVVVLAAAEEPPGGMGLGNKPGPDSVVASIDLTSRKAERISIPKGSSATVELKTKFDKAELADPEIANISVESPTRLTVSGKTFGTTQLILTMGTEQRLFHVTVEQDLALLADLIRSVSPQSDVQLQSINGTVVLRGLVPNADEAEQIVQVASLFQGGEISDQMTVSGVQQTMLRVVVAEVNRDSIRDLGFNWAIGGNTWSRDFFFANNVAGINPTTFSSSGLGDVRLGQNTYSVAGVGNTATTNVTFGFPRAEFQVFMNAMRENGLARTLAEPNLVAISGQTATFLAGGEVPIPVAQAGASAGAITIEYREFGVRLAFTPTIVGGQKIRLHVMTEVSEAVPGPTLAGGFPVFTFNTRRVESTIECGDTQTFAIAGLLSEDVRAAASKIPGLGDIPVLGSLFSSVNYQVENTELVVLVTPQLVEPLDPQQVAPPPGSLMTHPNDFELFAMGQLEGKPKARPEYERVPRERVPVASPPSASAGWSNSQLALRGPWGLEEYDTGQ